MAVVAFISQKGGVGKSTLSRALGREAANSGLTVKIADLDNQQTTSADWHRLRLNQEVEPLIPVQAYGSVTTALKEADNFDYFIVDAPARSSAGTLQIAKLSDLVIQPCGASLDDLRPAVRLFHELKAAGIPLSSMCFALCRVGTAAEEVDARSYLEDAGYSVLTGSLPEKTAYRMAQNSGRSITETRFNTLNTLADDLIADIAKRLEKNGKTDETDTKEKKPNSRSTSRTTRRERQPSAT